MNIVITVRIRKEENIYLIEALELPVDTFGKTLEEAEENFKEALELYFETAKELNTLDKILKKLEKEQKRKHLIEEIQPDYYYTRKLCTVPV